MSEKTIGRDLIGGKKEKTVQTKQLLIQGHLLRWEGVIIQISNISLITSTNLNPPGFPIWAAIAVLAGIALLKPIWYVGLIALAVGGFSIYSWYSEYEQAKDHKYLNILLNSGFTYSILFSNEAFLDEVMCVFANIFENGEEYSTNYYIDIKDSTIENGVVINNEYIYEQCSIDKELLLEIQRLAASIEKTEPLIAKTLEELKNALEVQNKPRISTLITELSTGTIASFLANIASSSLLSFLGIR